MTSDEDDLSLSPARNVPYNHRIQFYKLQRVLSLIDKNMTLVRTKVFKCSRFKVCFVLYSSKVQK